MSDAVCADLHYMTKSMLITLSAYLDTFGLGLFICMVSGEDPVPNNLNFSEEFYHLSSVSVNCQQTTANNLKKPQITQCPTFCT